MSNYTFKGLVDASGYVIQNVPSQSTDPNAHTPIDYSSYILLKLPKWNGTTFIEGWDTATPAQRILFRGQDEVDKWLQQEFFSKIALDADGRMAITSSSTTGIQSPQWKGMAPFTSTGTGTIDTFLIPIIETISFMTGTLIHDPDSTVVFGKDSIDVDLVDVDNVLGYGLNFVLFQFIVNHRISKGRVVEFDGKGTNTFPANVYLRIIYTSDIGSPAHNFLTELLYWK